MKIDFVTLFPDMVIPSLEHSIMKRAVEKGTVQFGAISPRDFATDKHRKVDDSPYGGGPGMVMMAPLIQSAVLQVKSSENCQVILTDPMGDKFNQHHAQELTKYDQLIFICGHYEGIDERVRTRIADRSYTIGDYVLTGGELPSLVMADSIVRLLPGVLGDPESHQDDSHTHGLLGFPLYTKPLVFEGEEVPTVLLSGNHKKIAEWRRHQQLLRTKSHRPDLFSQAILNPGDADKL